VAVILGAIILHEKIDGYILAGSAVIVAGGDTGDYVKDQVWSGFRA